MACGLVTMELHRGDGSLGVHAGGHGGDRDVRLGGAEGALAAGHGPDEQAGGLWGFEAGAVRAPTPWRRSFVGPQAALLEDLDEVVGAAQDVLLHERPRRAHVVLVQGLHQSRMLVTGRGDLGLDRSVEAVGQVVDHRAEQQGQPVGIRRQVDLPVEGVAEVGDPLGVAGGDGLLELFDVRLEPATCSGVIFLAARAASSRASSAWAQNRSRTSCWLKGATTKPRRGTSWTKPSLFRASRPSRTGVLLTPTWSAMRSMRRNSPASRRRR